MINYVLIKNIFFYMPAEYINLYNSSDKGIILIVSNPCPIWKGWASFCPLEIDPTCSVFTHHAFLVFIYTSINYIPFIRNWQIKLTNKANS